MAEKKQNIPLTEMMNWWGSAETTVVYKGHFNNDLYNLYLKIKASTK